jgi:hypothetical protein
MKINNISELLKDYQKDERTCSYVTHLDSKNTPHVVGVELRVALPMTSPGGLEHAIARKIAKEYNMTFEEYNVNRGTDDPPLYRPTFSIICHTESDVKKNIEKIKQAERELNRKFENLAELAMKS